MPSKTSINLMGETRVLTFFTGSLNEFNGFLPDDTLKPKDMEPTRYGTDSAEC